MEPSLDGGTHPAEGTHPAGFASLLISVEEQLGRQAFCVICKTALTQQLLHLLVNLGYVVPTRSL